MLNLIHSKLYLSNDEREKATTYWLDIRSCDRVDVRISSLALYRKELLISTGFYSSTGIYCAIVITVDCLGRGFPTRDNQQKNSQQEFQ